jgi:hypothetical protein
LSFYGPLGKDATDAMSKFLDKFKHAVIKFKCYVADPGDQQVITSFLNKCEILRFLSIGCKSWDWSLHTVCPTVHNLDFDRDSSETDITKLFFVFPGLKMFTEINESWEDMDSDADDGTVETTSNNMAMIEYFHSQNLVPPVQCLQAVKHVKLECHMFETLAKLVRYMPNLKALRELELTLSFDAVYDDPDGQVGQCLKQLIDNLPKSLVELNITSDYCYDEDVGCPYDLRIIKLLDRLPKTVRFIEYKLFTVR